MSTTDKIEKKVVLRAPRERVWNAISDSKQFGTWFGVDFDGPFVAGKRITGRMTPTKVDRDLAYLHLEVFSIRRAPGKLKYLAGSESAMGAFINDVRPEDAARLLREVTL